MRYWLEAGSKRRRQLSLKDTNSNPYLDDALLELKIIKGLTESEALRFGFDKFH